MFVFKKEQKVCRIGEVIVGGQPGENPPLMIGSMFHDGDRLLESRSQRKFDRVRATDYIKRLESLSQETGVPVLVDLQAIQVDEMKNYIDFFVELSNLPFAIDMWRANPRMEAARYVASLGVQDRVLYNSFTHWDGDIKEQAQELKELGFRHIVIQTYEKPGQMPADTLDSLRRLLALIGEDTFETVLVDTASVNLPSLALACVSSRMIKEELGYPVGCCPTTTTATWTGLRGLWGEPGFHAVDTAAHSLAALLWNDFIFFGPVAWASRTLLAVSVAEVIRGVLRAYETNRIPENEKHPLNLMFGEFVQLFRAELTKRSMPQQTFLTRN
ncbi:tetrahydromethanopterin S-methyltransferase subunit H family protein [Calderihabitans maritimus]|uniref:Tetrahydromethanopterin S-methyltransferase n=1 Tax=Calderihabitans maritimus TaxID=1246530 RepID=A0A1Z5HS90_9FIRM|nr:tetrahydromethanopterin S-methyltransferase subunit H [Calderihabitans maritimus]GAW92389.1 Tetrahydromethanopterin S-methyltransferase [Calderihabitans maritimus]